MKEKYGSVNWKGIEIALTQQAYPSGAYAPNSWEATGQDAKGNVYTVYWNELPKDEIVEDQFDTYCDWDNPSDIVLIEEAE